MALENKLGLTNPVDLACAEERISKKKAFELFDSGTLDKLEAEKFSALKAMGVALVFGSIIFSKPSFVNSLTGARSIRKIIF